MKIHKVPQLRVHEGGRVSEDIKALGQECSNANLRVASGETLARARSSLEREARAVSYLHGMGLTRETINYFRIGHDVRAGEHFIHSPVISETGVALSRFNRTRIIEGFPLVRVGAGACHGGPISTWCGPILPKDVLIVVEDIRDQWALWQFIQGTSMAVRAAILTTTYGSCDPDPKNRYPTEWEKPSFWSNWSEVYLAHDNDDFGEIRAREIRRLVKRDVRRLEPRRSMGTSWCEFVHSGGSVSDFEDALKDASCSGGPLPLTPTQKPLGELNDGDYEDLRVNINDAFVGHYMYYPFKVRRVTSIRQPDTAGDASDRKFSAYVTQVVRSDGEILGFSQDPAPPGTSKEDRVTTLDDGTETDGIPDPKMFCTWSLASIRAFSDSRRNGRSPHRPIGEILEDIEDYLKSAIWLPMKNDYALLAAYACMSHVYNAFSAIPMLLVTGEKGSGKTTAATALAGLSFNGYVMGKASQASLIRFADQGRGLLVLDDLEKVGRKSRNENGLGDINEVLKVSYDKATANKAIFSEGRVRDLNFFGPKVITNITGIDPVNRSRVFTIRCRPMPAAVIEGKGIMGVDPTRAEPIRQELHAWGMTRISEVHGVYSQSFNSRSDRAAQIAAPLLTVAELSGSKDFYDRLSLAISRQSQESRRTVPIEQLVFEAIEEMLRRGVRGWATLEQLKNELALMPEAQMMLPREEADENVQVLREPVQLGKMLRKLGVRSGAKGGRVNLCGKKVRTFQIEPSFERKVLDRLRLGDIEMSPPYPVSEELRAGTAFCDHTTCTRCPYEPVCEGATQLRLGKAED